MNCCEKPEMIGVSAKCSDLCHVIYPDGTEHQGYVPSGINIGGDDYIDFDYCKNCGKMKGTFPVEIPKGE
jgi:hypothetical protein